MGSSTQKAKHSDRPESPLSSVGIAAAACEAPHGPRPDVDGIARFDRGGP